MLQDYKLGLRMLLKYPGLTLAGGLALAIAIGVGAGWYDLIGKFMAPTIPLPEGDRIVLIETQNTLTNAPEPRVVRDFLEWRRELHTIEGLGAYRDGHPKSHRRQCRSRADPDSGAHGRRVPHGTCASPARSCPARLRRSAGSTQRGRARLRRVAARPRRPAGRCRIGRETGEHAGDRDRRHAGGFRVPGQPRRLDATVAPRLVRARSRAVRSASSAGWLPASRGSRRTPSCACSANGRPRRFRRRTQHLRPRVMRLGGSA